MAGGTFTITNIGVFGVDAGTPILNPGEAGILALGAIQAGRGSSTTTRSCRAGSPRWRCRFDHRVVDGEQGSRFLADVAAILHDPGLALAY